MLNFIFTTNVEVKFINIVFNYTEFMKYTKLNATQ